LEFGVCDKIQRNQAVAELGQAQFKLDVINKFEVNVIG